MKSPATRAAARPKLNLFSQKCVEFFHGKARLPQDALNGSSLEVFAGVNWYGYLTRGIDVVDETAMTAGRPRHRKPRAF